MGKILGSWSAMRKYLETEMLADSLHGMVRYNCTSYVGMGSCRVFEIFINDKIFKRFSWETLNTWFIDNGYTKNSDPYGRSEYWSDFWELYTTVPIGERTEYTDDEFCEALSFYRNHDVNGSLASEDPLCRMFAILDRRVGKRTLEKERQKKDEQPDWLKQIYQLRFENSSSHTD